MKKINEEEILCALVFLDFNRIDSYFFNSFLNVFQSVYKDKYEFVNVDKTSMFHKVFRQEQNYIELNKDLSMIDNISDDNIYLSVGAYLFSMANIELISDISSIDFSCVIENKIKMLQGKEEEEIDESLSDEERKIYPYKVKKQKKNHS